MYAFWKWLLQSLFDALKPRVVVEIGAGSGRNTTNLVEWAASNGAVVHVIDPAPGFDVEQWQARHGEALILHVGRSVDVLPTLGAVDVALIDGDHNWYTVHRELALLAETAAREGSPMPLVFATNVSWPYARRDTYADPEAVPPEHRHPYRKAGIVIGQSELSDTQGINGGLFNAEHEGAPRNGVLTAIEDFLAEYEPACELQLVHGFSGLAVLVPAVTLETNAALRAALEHLRSPMFLEQHTRRLEQVHTTLHMTFARQRRELREANKALAALQERVTAAESTPRRTAARAVHVPLQLRVAFAGSDRMARLMGGSCELIPLDVDEWERTLSRGAAQGLLVETVAQGEPAPWSHEALTDPGGPLAELLAHCRGRGIPTVFWGTLDGAALGPFLPQVNRFVHHFVADPEAAPRLASELTAETPPGVLPLAVQPLLHRPPQNEDARDGRPLYLGGWGEDWDDPLKRALGGLLGAAMPHGLRIAVPAGAPADFPADFAPAVQPVADLAEEIGLLQKAPVVIAFHPAAQARTYVPRAVFEALACGAAVVTQPNWGITHYLGDTVAVADSPSETAEQLALLLADEQERRRRVARAQRYIELAHTYDHRLATIASGAGLSVVPQPPPLEPVM